MFHILIGHFRNFLFNRFFEIPTIICTGYSSRISETKASEIGVKAFLMKPLNKSELAEKVRKVLDRIIF